MKNSENIDKIFSEGLHNYEHQPRSEAWEKLQARLEKPQSKVLALWWKFASAASVALLLSVGGYWYNSQKIISDKNIATINPPQKNITKECLQKSTMEESVATAIGKSTQTKQRKNIIKTANTTPQNVIAITKVTKTDEILHTKNSLSPTLSPEIKKVIEPNTIVLVLEDTNPKNAKEEETIILNFVEAKQESVAQTDANEENFKKQSRLSKIWQQLKRAKNGEDVNWGEVGIKPQKVLARADAKIENALKKGEFNEK